MARYKITIIVESDEDPSGIMDDFEYVVDSEMDTCELDPTAEEDGEAVSVESMD